MQSGWLSAEEFRAWRAAYEAAGIDRREVAPSDLQQLASTSGVVVASTAKRALESAQALARGRDVVASPLLVELELVPPALPIRLPLRAWALTYAIRWVRGEHFTPKEEERAREAADWLTRLAEEHESVVAVTHGSFRSLLRDQLVRTGWRCTVPRGRMRHWSAWAFVR